MKDNRAIAAATVFLIALLAFPLAAAQPRYGGVNFSSRSTVTDIANDLAPYNAAAGQEKDGSRWYLITAANQSPRTVTRILEAAEPPDAGFHLFPRRGRPQILQIATADPAVSVERAYAFARHAYKITIPPAASAALALRVAYADDPPQILAWTEGALAAHNRQLALFLAGVAGLIAAAALIMAGVAMVTAHPAPGWAAAVLTLLFLMRLQSSGSLDNGWVTFAGGPYGLSAMLAGFGLAAGIRLTDIAVPIADRWPWAQHRLPWIWRGLIALGLAAFVGIPGATILVKMAVLIGTAAVATYLVYSGMNGSKAARVLAPSAAIFALVSAVSAILAFGVTYQTPMMSNAIAGFAASGAVLLALAVAAGEGIAILPLTAGGKQTAVPEPEKRIDTTPKFAADALKAIQSAHLGIFDLDFHTSRLRLSGEAARVIGVKQASAAVTHDSWIGRIHPEDRKVYSDALQEYRTHPGLAFRVEFRARKPDGRYPWLELRATILGKGSAGDRCLGLIADITSRPVAEPVRAEDLASDPLKSLGNRASLVKDLEQLADRWARAALAILDIDRFKAIHASLGDAGGDEVLRQAATRLSQAVQGWGKIYRIGGDAFAAIISDAGEDCASFGAQMIAICAAPFVANGRSIFASASAGVAACRDAGSSADLLRHAEMALAQAKEEGGDRSKFFLPGMVETGKADTVVLEAELREGLAGNQFDIFYQPIVHMQDGRIAGFEALLRWRHPRRGVISAAELIAHSEATGWVTKLGQFVLERAAGDLAGWQREFPADPALFVSVNVSRRQLQESGFVSAVRNLLQTYQIRPGTLSLEITESAIDLNKEVTLALAELRDAGARLAIDDFGTGASTLSQLKDLPFDTLKIDKSFLSRTGVAPQRRAVAVLRSIIALAHELERAVVAEGVEREEDVAWLRDEGCEYAQGFYFGEPIPRAEMAKYLAAHLGGRRTTAAADAGASPDQARPA